MVIFPLTVMMYSMVVGVYYLQESLWENLMKRGELNDIIKNVAFLGQLGLSLIMPVLLCIALCVFLSNRFNIGAWIYIPGFIFGFGASFMTAYKFYISETKKSKKEEKKTISFNKHE